MRLIAIAVSASLCVLGALSLLWPSTPARERAEQLPQFEGYGIVRRVNTAEAEYRASNQSYGNLEQILGQRMFQSPGANTAVPTATDETCGTLKDYKLCVISSRDGKHYTLSLVRTDTNCGPAFFSDESGVIYPGAALGCPAPTGDSSQHPARQNP